MHDEPAGLTHGAADHAAYIAHLSLQLGRLLLQNGSDSAHVHDAVLRFVAVFGDEAELLVTYEGLLLTVADHGQFRTKLGHAVQTTGVGLAVIGRIDRLVEDAERGGVDLARAAVELDAIESQPGSYSRWMVAAALGLTAASLARLFGGDWAAVCSVFVAGIAGTALRLELGRRHTNPVLIPFTTALVSGAIGALAVRLSGSATPALGLVAPGMILVPGVPLINAVKEMIGGHVSVGVSRLGFAGLVIAAIGLGLFLATAVTGVAIPVDAPTRILGVPEDALFSALAAGGYAFLFGVPLRLAWACVLCGIGSHTLRTLWMQFGLGIASGTLIGAVVAGVLACVFARAVKAPPVAFAFPGVVAMIPGAFAFRGWIGTLQIMHLGAAAPAPLIAETFSLGVDCVLMVAAIAIGIAVAISVLESPRRQISE
jgi:uncharacterized membrane protein YjjP (DUF1212 family)